MSRFPLWRSLAATLLLIAVLVALRAPIGNAARHDETRSPSSCDVTMTGGGMDQDDAQRGTPGGGMDQDDTHMDSRDDDKPCDDSHRGSPVAGVDCWDMMGSPVAGMGRDANRMGTPGGHMNCDGMGMDCDGNRMGTPGAPMDCDGMPMDCDGMNGTPTAGRDCDGMDSDSD